MQKRRMIVLLFVMALVLIVCGREAKAAPVQFISIGTAQLGGGTYNNCLAMATAANLSLTDYKVEALPTSGAVEALRMLRDKEVEIASIGIDAAYNVYNGLDRYKGNPWNNLRLMFPQFGTYVNIIVPKNSSIRSFGDMKGKRVGVGNPGSAGYFLITHILRAHGLKEGDYKEVALDNSEQGSALKDGHLDVYGFYTTPNSPAIVELSTAMDVRWIPIDKEKWVAYSKATRLPFTVVDVPAGTYKGMDAAIPTISGMNYIVSRSDIAEDMVYQFTKAFFSNFNVAVQSVSAISQVKDLLPTAQPVAPMHPGAVKYFREAGMKFNDFAK